MSRQTLIVIIVVLLIALALIIYRSNVTIAPTTTPSTFPTSNYTTPTIIPSPSPTISAPTATVVPTSILKESTITPSPTK